jgi:hypothetical protein
MSASAITARLVEALEQAAGADATLVSVSVELLAAPGPGAVEIKIDRKTRTLVFLSAALVGDDGGARIATAASVHKVAA